MNFLTSHRSGRRTAQTGDKAHLLNSTPSNKYEHARAVHKVI